MTKILKCTCQHEYQDEIYGKGNRVHNPLKTSQHEQPKYRCTVCKQEKT